MKLIVSVDVGDRLVTVSRLPCPGGASRRPVALMSVIPVGQASGQSALDDTVAVAVALDEDHVTL